MVFFSLSLSDGVGPTSRARRQLGRFLVCEKTNYFFLLNSLIKLYRIGFYLSLSLVLAYTHTHKRSQAGRSQGEQVQSQRWGALKEKARWKWSKRVIFFILSEYTRKKNSLTKKKFFFQHKGPSAPSPPTRPLFCITDDDDDDDDEDDDVVVEVVP